MNGKLKRVMIIGKGSLFLGRMTNLFDGVSFVIQENSGPEASGGVSEEQVKRMIAKAMRNLPPLCWPRPKNKVGVLMEHLEKTIAGSFYKWRRAWSAAPTAPPQNCLDRHGQ